MKLTRYNRILILTVIVVTLVSVAIVFWQRAVSHRRAQCVELNGDWDIRFAEENTIAFQKTLTNLPDLVLPAVFFKTGDSAVEVFLDGDVIYDADMALLSEGRFIGKRVHFVNLPHDVEGKVMKILLYPSRGGEEDDATIPLYGSYPNLFRLYFQASLPALAGGSFLLLFGLIFLFLTTFLSIRMAGTAQHVVAALICVVLGAWMIGAYDMSLILRTQSAESLVEWGMFYLIVPLFSLLLYYLYGENPALIYVAAAGFAAGGVILMLHGMSMVPAETFSLFYELLMAAACTALLIYFFRYRYGIYAEPTVAVQERGIVIFAVCFLVHLVIALFRRILHDPTFADNNQIAILGGFVFATTQILNYYLNISESYARRKEYASLNQLAYVDMLTGLPNRKSAQNVMRGLNNAYGNYCIVSFDLNGLKEMNDVYGHGEGDKMLKETADVLNNVFGDRGFRARLGGDEFIVVLKRVNRETVRELCEKVNEELMRLGRKTVGVDHSISYGYAFREECPDAPSDDVMRLADERMYRMKEAHHEKKNRIRRGGRT